MLADFHFGTIIGNVGDIDAPAARQIEIDIVNANTIANDDTQIGTAVDLGRSHGALTHHDCHRVELCERRDRVFLFGHNGDIRFVMPPAPPFRSCNLNILVPGQRQYSFS